MYRLTTGWADRSRMYRGAESASVACAQGKIWGAAHRGAGLVEQVEGSASTLAHLGATLKQPLWSPWPWKRSTMIGKRQPASEELGCR